MNKSTGRGTKWAEPLKSEPWRGPVLSWDSIKDSFPGIHSPEEALRRTAKACKKLGLIKTSDSPPLTDGQIEHLRWKQKNERRAQERKAAL